MIIPGLDDFAAIGFMMAGFTIAIMGVPHGLNLAAVIPLAAIHQARQLAMHGQWQP